MLDIKESQIKSGDSPVTEVTEGGNATKKQRVNKAAAGGNKRVSFGIQQTATYEKGTEFRTTPSPEGDASAAVPRPAPSPLVSSADGPQACAPETNEFQNKRLSFSDAGAARGLLDLVHEDEQEELEQSGQTMEFTGNVPLLHGIAACSNCEDEEEEVPSFTGDATCSMEFTAVMPATSSAFLPPSSAPIFPEANSGTQHFTEMTGFSLPAADDTTANLDMKLALSLKDRQSLYADDTGTHDLTGLLVAATSDSVNSSTYTDVSAHVSHSQPAADAPTPTGTDGFTSRLRRAGSLTHNDSRCLPSLFHLFAFLNHWPSHCI